MSFSSSKPTSSFISRWEEAGTTLANALAQYLELSTLLETSCPNTDKSSSDLVARIDSSLRKLHPILSQQLDQSRTTLTKTRNKLTCSIYRFPEEILSEIFVHVVFSAEGEIPWGLLSFHDGVRASYNRLYSLISVCSLWRGIAINRPLFWRIVPMVDTEATLWKHLSPKLIIQRSGGQGLHFALYSRSFLSKDQRETLNALLPHLPKAQALSVTCGSPIGLGVTLIKLLQPCVPESLSELSELSICYLDEKSQSSPPRTSEIQYLNGRASCLHTILPLLITRLAILKLKNVLFMWQNIRFSTRLVELRLEKLSLAGNSAILSFLNALSSAHGLRKLAVIKIEAFTDQYSLIPSWPRISLPVFELLYSKYNYLNFCSLLLNSIAPGSYRIILRPEDFIFYSLFSSPDSVRIRTAHAHALLAHFRIDTLILSGTVPEFQSPHELHDLLRSMTSLKTLIFDAFVLDDTLIQALQPSVESSDYPFPKLETILFRRSHLLDHLPSLKSVVASHPLRRMVLGLGLDAPDLHGRELVELEEEDDLVRWLKENVPGFELIRNDRDRPELIDGFRIL